jgi:hypothetical protein
MKPIINPYVKRKPTTPGNQTTPPVKKYKSTVDNDNGSTTSPVLLHAITTSTVTPDQTVKKFTGGTTESLGRLRARHGVAFHWIYQPFIKENSAMGRVYFQGFSFCGKEYYIGDVVDLKTNYLNQTVCIISAFQATKSFQGNAYGDGHFLEIQKRGKFVLNREKCGILDFIVLTVLAGSLIIPP